MRRFRIHQHGVEVHKCLSKFFQYDFGSVPLRRYEWLDLTQPCRFLGHYMVLAGGFGAQKPLKNSALLRF
jgi:hypothetical protein